ncbi:MAG: hypothetical protein KKF48_01890 [Nanoarchaeota archaeon]|nr:hypothetical protein [Nanoarchaeota archaeon]MBU1027771.1 hypothetical protein [Nanoarchaeota archaeon]
MNLKKELKTNKQKSEVLDTSSTDSQCKAIIFDASTLISLSMNGLINELIKLKSIFKGYFIVTSDVKREIIDKPITIKRFELEALRLKQLLDEKILEMPSVLNVDEKELSQKMQEIKKISNTTFYGKDKNLNLIHSGEASCLALSKILTNKQIKNVVAVDERTMRMFCEKPQNLKKLLEKKLHTQISVKTQNFEHFKGFKLIRSAELVYVAYKKGLVNLKNEMVLDALLYAVKFKGCSISGTEIDEIKRIK